MIVTTNIFALPFLLVLWALDAWIILLSAHLVLPHVRAAWASRACTAISPFTDGLLMPLTRWAQGRWPQVSAGAVGVAALLICLLIRQLAIRVIVGLA